MSKPNFKTMKTKLEERVNSLETLVEAATKYKAVNLNILVYDLKKTKEMLKSYNQKK